MFKVAFANAVDTSAGFIIPNTGERCGCGDALGAGFEFLSRPCCVCYIAVSSMGSPSCYVQSPCYEADTPAIYTCVSSRLCITERMCLSCVKG